MGRHWIRGSIAILAIAFLPLVARGQQIDIATPADERFLRDGLHLLTEEDGGAVQQVADTLLAEKAVPLYVVVIDSMKDHSRARKSIEQFSRSLYEQWGRDEQFIDSPSWHNGILLVVARADRKARIELGRDWGGRYDSHCARIMNEVLVPRFRNGNYSLGIVEGVNALDEMARGGAPPSSAAMEDWKFILLIAVGSLGAFLVVWFIAWLIERLNPRKRRHLGDGFDHIVWGDNEYGNGVRWEDRRHSVGGGFGGGFGGGGFGGGGGATGSW